MRPVAIALQGKSALLKKKVMNTVDGFPDLIVDLRVVV